MTDVISSGPERPVRRRRRHTWPVLLVLMVAAVAAVRLWGGVSGSPRAAPRTPQVSPVPVTTETPSGRVATFRLTGRPGPVPDGLRLLINGTFTQSGKATSPATVGADGKVTPLAGVRPAVQLPTSVQRLAGATGVIVRNQGFQPVDTYVAPDHGGNVHLGAGLDTVLTAYGGGYLAANSGAEVVETGRLVSYSGSGQPRWERKLKDPTYFIRDTAYGLLADVVAPSQPDQSDHGSLALLDARTGHLLHGIGAVDVVLASTDEKVAWIPYGCGEWPGHCTLAVTDLRTRQEQTIALPDGWAPAAAAFSPNGTMLALSFAGKHAFADQVDPDGYVSVLTLPTETFQRMPGLTTPVKQAPTLAWGPDLQLLIGVHVSDDEDRLLLYSPGWPGLVVLPPRLAPDSASTYLAVLS
ncbi:MAG: hypothetical protein V7637_5763 [Mycobacteriales bacterium]